MDILEVFPHFVLLFLSMAVFTYCYEQTQGHLGEAHREVRAAGGIRTSCPHFKPGDMLKMYHGKRTSTHRQRDRQAKHRIRAAKILQQHGFSTEVVQDALAGCQIADFLDCDSEAKYRTADGNCNNLENPDWGQAGSAQIRLVSSAYGEDISDPRNESVLGGPLPNVRTISNVVHAAKSGRAARSRSLTLQAFQMGQFLDHDIIATPVQAEVEDCCSPEGLADADNCFPIIVENTDSTFEAGYCMHFPRSAPYFSSKVSQQREQQSVITSFIDASNVYGSSQEEQNELREAGTPFLRTEEGDRLPNNPSNSTCLPSTVDGIHCSLAGDHRVNEVPSLTSYHTLFVREHNRIASAIMHPACDNETVFQETRKILIAVMQKTVYDEFLPSILSDATMRKYGLAGRAPYTYNPSLNPTVANGFGIAYRFGHTWIPRSMDIYNKQFDRLERTSTEQTYFRPDLTYPYGDIGASGLEGLAYALSAQKSFGSDAVIEDEARNSLFINENGDSLDLAALNIQRGRDHGLPGYNEYRLYCGLSSLASNWSTGNGRLVDHDKDMVSKIRTVYASPLDIDLFTGVLTERNNPASEVGPTLNCILGDQFSRLKYGDRFWYQGTAAGFTSEQLAQIKKASMSRVLCDNYSFDRVHRNAFMAKNKLNCADIESMDLTKFYDSKGGGMSSSTKPPRPTPRPPGSLIPEV